MRTLRRIFAAAALCAAGPAFALDAPHDALDQTSACSACHILHRAPGAALTNQAGNVNVCQQCHASITDPDGKHGGMPWVSEHQAIPGAGGRSHRWDAEATSRGARAPLHPEMAKRLEGGKLQCSTCHDQHNNGGRPGDPTFHGGTQKVGGDAGAAGTVAVGKAWLPSWPAYSTGSGQMRLVEVTAAAAPKRYRVALSVVTATTVTFKVSHDEGKSWFAYSGGSWAPDTTGIAPGRTVALDTPVELDDGVNVRVSFPSVSGYKVGDGWDFWITYPFLRTSNVDDAMCEDCHADRVHSSLRVAGGDATYPADGTRYFSHPVGEALARPYDRATVLDANGAPQVASGADADGNPTNNIRLDSASRVRCTSCHAVHNADSNSLSQDAR